MPYTGINILYVQYIYHTHIVHITILSLEMDGYEDNE